MSGGTTFTVSSALLQPPVCTWLQELCFPAADPCLLLALSSTCLCFTQAIFLCRP